MLKSYSEKIQGGKKFWWSGKEGQLVKELVKLPAQVGPGYL